MSDQNLGGRVRAKTGTLRDVCALSGYLDRPDGRRLVFSFVANHYSVSTASIRAAQERLCALIAQSR
jgi:D-alanyl-D-alanine carboxypeptidase/D-alanyl-D-alanine-endopeptidase (penicillin-binding protein 4)